MKLEIWSFQPARWLPVRSVTLPGGLNVKAGALTLPAATAPRLSVAACNVL